MPLTLNTEAKTREVLDFSKLVINDKEELEKYLEKIPDYRMRPDKVRVEDLKMEEKNFTFSATKSELEPEQYEFAWPIPPPLDQVKLEEIRNVDISWQMLTRVRPETKIDEEIFNRIVEFERSTYKTILHEQEQAMKKQTKSKKSKSKSTVKSNSTEICLECGDEFCIGSCQKFLYEEHERLPLADDEGGGGEQEKQPPLLEEDQEKKVKKKIKKKVKKKIPKESKEKEKEKNKDKDVKVKTSVSQEKVNAGIKKKEVRPNNPKQPPDVPKLNLKPVKTVKSSTSGNLKSKVVKKSEKVEEVKKTEKAKTKLPKSKSDSTLTSTKKPTPTKKSPPQN